MTPIITLRTFHIYPEHDLNETYYDRKLIMRKLNSYNLREKGKPLKTQPAAMHQGSL